MWLADIAEHRADEGKLHLCATKDVYSNRIVGYSIDVRMKSTLAVAALTNAVALRSPVATIVHPDRGSQFRSRKFVPALSRNGLYGSMGRVGACGDNAAMESFFALLQRNVLPATLVYPSRTTPGDRHRDRADLSPTPAPTHLVRPPQTYESQRPQTVQQGPRAGIAIADAGAVGES